MSDVKRYWVPHNVLVDQSGWHQDDTCVVQDWEYDKLKTENDLYLGLLCMAKELLTTISRNGATLKPADWCDNFKAEVADRIEKIDAAISSPENP